MWAIKILNGPQQGKVFPLQKGNNILGRSTKADIRIADNGISKNHAQIFITNDKAIVSDLKSSNGTFVNGVRVQNHGLKTGDKILVNQTMITIFQLPDNVVFSDKLILSSGKKPSEKNALAISQPQSITPYNTQTNLATTEANTALVSHTQHQSFIEKVTDKTNSYIDDVALPPIYKATEKFELKNVLMMFTLVFVFIITFLSIFPLSKVAKESVFEESKRRALTLARNMEQMNRKAMADDSDLSLSTDFIAREPGVERAVILSAQGGGIIAPASYAGRYINDPFIAGFIKKKKEKKINDEEVLVEEINEKQIGASVPFKFYDADSGQSVVKAYAIVIYNIDPMITDFKRILGLFVQVFLVSVFIGLLVYFVQYRLFLHPLQVLNAQLDEALKSRSNDIRVPLKMKVFQDLIVKINSALSQLPQDFASNESLSSVADKSVEASEVIHLFPVFAFAIDPASTRFIAVNDLVHENSWFSTTPLINTKIDDIQDSALNEVLRNLVLSSISAPNSKHVLHYKSTDHGEFQFSVKAISEGQKLAYLIFTVMPIANEAVA